MVNRMGYKLYGKKRIKIAPREWIKTANGRKIRSPVPAYIEVFDYKGGREVVYGTHPNIRYYSRRKNRK